MAGRRLVVPGAFNRLIVSLSCIMPRGFCWPEVSVISAGA